VLLGFWVAFVSTPAGVSGSFLLLPLQVSLLGVVAPSASATNLIYNLVSTPGAIFRYRQQGQTDPALVIPIALGTFLTSVVGVATFALLPRTGSPQAAPDWIFGGSAGLGGLVGSYAGARLHTHLPESLMQIGLSVFILALAISYLIG